MKVMCDPELIADVLLDRRPFADDASVVLDLCEQGRIDGYIPAASVPDIYYLVFVHAQDSERANDALTKLLQIVRVCSLTNEDVVAALEMGQDNFDSRLTAACAQSIGCSCIVTRQKTAYQGITMELRTPGEVAAQFAGVA